MAATVDALRRRPVCLSSLLRSPFSALAAQSDPPLPLLSTPSLPSNQRSTLNPTLTASSSFSSPPPTSPASTCSDLAFPSPSRSSPAPAALISSTASSPPFSPTPSPPSQRALPPALSLSTPPLECPTTPSSPLTASQISDGPAQINPAMPFSPPTSTIANMISSSRPSTSLCKKGDLETACNVLDGMEKTRIKPDIISFNALLTGDTWQKGMMMDLKRFLRISKFCRDLQTFNAEELPDVMVSKGIQPNWTTFNTIIGGFSREGDVDSAVRMFKKMKVMKRRNGSEGVSPNANIYNALMRGLVEKREFGNALPICKECLNDKLAPPFEVVKD
ncbi:pentatricopeptide repeat-containing protein [Canna indica]|uniref:Pentatricopeptide repeat-containing protein n=1 Tax=Canna indica TaxID=4628 RepID=A0AAQ3JWQ0_9LILI|nr:pentatricopeptide repeat-containing protein [Canna indica]